VRQRLAVWDIGNLLAEWEQAVASAGEAVLGVVEVIGMRLHSLKAVVGVEIVMGRKVQAWAQARALRSLDQEQEAFLLLSALWSSCSSAVSSPRH